MEEFLHFFVKFFIKILNQSGSEMVIRKRFIFIGMFLISTMARNVNFNLMIFILYHYELCIDISLGW